MLYTRKGDQGDTCAYNCDQRFSKSSELAEALGAVDEINSLLGICKIKAKDFEFSVIDFQISEIIEQVQQSLFTIQANLAGADKKIDNKKVEELEKIIDALEKEMPPIKTFFLSGGTELSAIFDYSRSVARRAERRVVALSEKGKISPEILPYMNRLSSLLYALARFVNVKSGAEQTPPSYQ